VEPVFNIDLEKQAVGRIRRIGQQHTCHVVRMVAHNTIEANMYASRRRALAQQQDEQRAGVSSGIARNADSVSVRDLKSLLADQSLD
jgi:SNF2 family DNA or RNA helicase